MLIIEQLALFSDVIEGTKRTMSFNDLESEYNILEGSVEAKIKADQLSITFDDELYVFIAIKYLGSSQPFASFNQYLIGRVASYRHIWEQVGSSSHPYSDYLLKGTESQIEMWDILKKFESDNFFKTSFGFQMEWACSVYSLNRLQHDLQFNGEEPQRTTRPLKCLATDFETLTAYDRKFENDIFIKPFYLMEWLSKQFGTVVLTKQLIEELTEKAGKTNMQIKRPR